MLGEMDLSALMQQAERYDDEERDYSFRKPRSLQEFMAEGKSGKKQRRPARRKGQLTEEQHRMLGEAQTLYTNGKFAESLELVHRLIKEAPKAPDPYRLLGLIHEEANDEKKALELYMIAAHLSLRGGHIWKSLASVAAELNDQTRTLYCWDMAVKRLRRDPEPLWQRAQIHIAANNTEKAISDLQRLVTLVTAEKEDEQDEQEGAEDEEDDELTVDDRKAVLASYKLPAVHLLASQYKLAGMLKEGISMLGKFLFLDIEPQPGQVPPLRTPVEMDLANMLVEFYLDDNQFSEVISLIGRTRGTLKTGESLPVEFTVNYGIALAYLGKHVEARTCLNILNIDDYPVDTYGELYYSIAEMYAALDMHQDAIIFFRELHTSEIWNEPSVWLKEAQSFRSIGDLDKAVELFSMVFDRCVGNLESLSALCEIFEQRRELGRAVTVLERFIRDFQLMDHDQQENADALVIQMKVKRANYLYDLRRYKPFVVSGKSVCDIFMNQQFVLERKLPEKKPSAKEPEEEDTFFGAVANRSRRKKVDADGTFAPPPPRVLTQSRPDVMGEASEINIDVSEDETMQPPPPIPEESMQEAVPIKQEQDIQFMEMGKLDSVPPLFHLMKLLGAEPFVRFVLRLCKVMAASGMYADAARIIQDTFQCARVTRFDPTGPFLELRTLCVRVNSELGEHERAMLTLRSLLTEYPDNIALWNLFNDLSSKSGLYFLDHPQRFLMRQLEKFPEKYAINVLVGNHLLMSSNFQSAIEEFRRVLSTNPDDAYGNLCLGLAHVLQAQNRRLPDRNQTILQGFAYLQQYAKIRGPESQEVLFNLARAHHQLGILHIAEAYYKRVLMTEPTPNQRDIRREAAFNLSQMYVKNGSEELARFINERYCTL